MIPPCPVNGGSLMELTAAHLRYLLAIYELTGMRPQVVAVDVAKALKVSKPSVTRMLGVLRERGLLQQERYGKIFLTEEGSRLAAACGGCVQRLSAGLESAELGLTEEERLSLACLLAASLPARVLDTLMHPPEAKM